MHSKVRTMIQIALVTAVICIISPFSIPIGPVPISFSILAIYLGLYALNWKWGSLSVLLYILIGLVGLPVFSGFKAGISCILGPTGGFLIGYILVALISGSFIDRFERKRYMHVAGMIIGLVFCYALGTAWFMYVTGNGALTASLLLCVWPFIPGDIIKILIAVWLGPVIRKNIRKISGC